VRAAATSARAFAADAVDPGDDRILPFAVPALDTRGRVARLGPALNRILAQHAYSEPVARALGEAVVLTALLGSALKIEGRFQLQTKTTGAINMIVVDFDTPDRLRAFARFDKARFEPGATPAALIGAGHMAFTIEMEAGGRYQGMTPLDGQGLEAGAHQYFRQSEQIPTFVRLAVAQQVTPQGTRWRGGGLLIQFLPTSDDRRRQADLDPGDAPPGTVPHVVEEDDAWVEARALAATVEDHELVDPALASETLLYRLFHERGATVFETQEVVQACRCSAERIEAMLRGFSPHERRDMIGANGLIGVTCEFCSVLREFDPADFGEDSQRAEGQA
jgi:molecular chaperone Hsp33